jgi:predicted transcriptional regulator
LFAVLEFFMANLRIPSAAAKRVARLAERRKRSAQRVLDSALRSGLDYEEWFERSVAAGLADLANGKVLTHQRVLKAMATRKARLARALKKAA